MSPKVQDKIPYTKPSITDLEINYATDAAANGWGERCYDYIYKFENRFKDYVGTSFAISTSSCTGALHMGMKALGIGPGDEVILADTNWIATVSPVVHLGAKPVFVDIEEESWCLDPIKVENAITKRTKAIIAVHLYGNLVDMSKLLSISKKYNVYLIEDAAEAIGSVYLGKNAGCMGIFGAFSFHGTKTITTGEGGALVTNDSNLYEKVLTLSNHGRSKFQKKQFWADNVGYKYKMSNIQAAIGLAQIERIEELVARKREILSQYKNYLSKFNGLTFNYERTSCINGAWMPTVVFDDYLNINRDSLSNAFAEKKIDARVFFWPLSSLPMFTSQRNNINSWSIPERAINLPSFHDISEEQIMRSVNCIHHLFHRTK